MAHFYFAIDKHHVADALVEEFCGARQDRKIIALLRSHITPIGLIELVRETDLEINGVLGNIWLADQRDLSSVLRMCPPYCSPELWNRTDKERLQQQLAGLIKRREAFQVVKEE